MGFIFRMLLLRLLPVLNFSNVLTPQLFVEFVDSFDELRRRIGCCLGFDFGPRPGADFRPWPQASCTGTTNRCSFT